MIDLPVIHQRDGCQDAAQCRACGGRCCQTAPGIAAPQDFGPRETLVATIASYLRTGFWCIDCWEGDIDDRKELSQILWVRPASLDRKGKLTDFAWAHLTPCALWTQECGCSLSFENRPHQCRHLQPAAPNEKGERDCQGQGKEEYARQWRPFQREVEAALEMVRRERGK
jgi:hypothetical protein